MKKGDIVYIEWDDIRTDLSTSGNPEPIKAIAVGKVEVVRPFVRLTSGWYEDAEWTERDTIVIPRGCINRIEVLK